MNRGVWTQNGKWKINLLCAEEDTSISYEPSVILLVAHAALICVAYWEKEKNCWCFDYWHNIYTELKNVAIFHPVSSSI